MKSTREPDLSVDLNGCSQAPDRRPFSFLRKGHRLNYMDTDYFQHPQRFPKNSDGPFYTTGHQSRKTNSPNSPLTWCGDCLSCEAPELEAPELLAPLDDDNLDTYFVRQPTTLSEIEHACMAARVCCVRALRYGGLDSSIIMQLQNDPELCDYIVSADGQLQMTVDANGDLLPFAQRIVDKRHRQLHKKWWQFWL